ncbi:helix-turn-helix domain-containing protein [Spirosoma radiotolerans]|uniref:AraC family transcriptional regulator n=1 Tax=Spirosoma radiotolerans TaxID=1379870 RepID=A0A0E3V5B4_9BACT|nr:helix-turn-helix domain-containing protein [Spirosoma radiotolerans]AKD54007.1 AraC family transcriptional regulator [Spirosoma radiotolerans]
MQETKGLLDKIKHHDKLSIMVNENCTIALPDDVLPALLRPHKLAYYYFMFVDRGAETCQVDLLETTVSDSQLIFGLPNQVFAHSSPNKNNRQYKFGFDENTLALLPNAFPFLINPLHVNVITFDSAAKERVKAILSILFHLLHSPGKPTDTAIILAHLNALLTEFNSAYFEGKNYETFSNSKLSKYVEFKLAVETQLTEQHDVHTIAEKLGMTTSSLYAVVKEYSGNSPKEWITNRLIQEAQRKLQYSSLSVKELAYELGYNDPAYFSRLFKKRMGKSVRVFLAGLQDLSPK